MKKNYSFKLLGICFAIAIIAFICGIIFMYRIALSNYNVYNKWLNYHCAVGDVKQYLHDTDMNISHTYCFGWNCPNNGESLSAVFMCNSGFKAYQEYEKENPTPTPTPLHSLVYPTITSTPTTYYTCKPSGNGLSCNNGMTIENNGGQLRSEHGGTVYREIGNQIVGSDGSTCTPSGGGQYTCSN